MGRTIPNRNIDLTKTNYFRNLERKASSEYEKEVLNCIKLLESRIIKLEDTVVRLADSHNGAMKAIGEAINTLDDNVKALADIVTEGGETMDA